MNFLAAGGILLNIAVMIILWLCRFDKEDLPMMIGVLCGAVTNTPGLGAANEALSQMGYSERICLRLSFRCGRNHLCHYTYKASVQGQSVQGEGDAF